VCSSGKKLEIWAHVLNSSLQGCIMTKFGNVGRAAYGQKFGNVGRAAYGQKFGNVGRAAYG